MGNINKHEALDLAAKADSILANGIIYFVERVDYDDGVVHCTDWCGRPCIIDGLILAQSYYAKFYTMEEIK